MRLERLYRFMSYQAERFARWCNRRISDGRRICPATCYVVLKVDTRLAFPVVVGVGMYSESAGTLTSTKKDILFVDVFKMEGMNFQDAHEKAADTIRNFPAYAWMVPWLEDLCDPEDVLERERQARAYVDRVIAERLCGRHDDALWPPRRVSSPVFHKW